MVTGETNDIIQKKLNEIIQKIEVILSDFYEQKNENIIKRTIDTVKKVKLYTSLIRIIAFFLNTNFINVGIFIEEDTDTENIFEDLYCIRKNLSKYSKQLDNIECEIKKLNSETEIILILKKIRIISQLICGQYNLIEDIFIKNEDNELIRKK